MSPSPEGDQSNRSSARSRYGCLTCKRRKVKCDELRPRCSHCERLNLECKWPQSFPTNSHKRRSRQTAGASAASSNAEASRTPMPEMEPAPSGPLFQTPPLHAVNQLFDYASFLWNTGAGTGDMWQHMSPAVTTGQGVPFDSLGHNGHNGHNSVVPAAPINSSPQASINLSMQSRLIPSSYGNSEPSTIPDTSCTGTGTSYPDQDDLLEVVPSETVAAENHRLMDYFAHAVTPPILAEVETQKNWFAMRQVLVGMSNASRMIRWAILAFSNLMLCRRDGNWLASQQNHYDNAAAEVAAYDGHPAEAFLKQSADRTNLLTTLFFLSYVDILEARIKTAHTHLKRAYNIFQHGDKTSFTPIEKQFLLWIRLLDGRAVSAGGDGLFLEKDEEPLLVDVPSPNILKTATNGPEARDDDPADDDIEDTLFQVLYQPGILFFQKVQSFMGRISKIDPWHRPRGTVEDETEVMNTGQSIAADLRALYEQRPPLMDIAVAGRLTPPHVSAHLAAVVTRAFRTYLSNYYASKVHLHRVAYKAFPLTAEAADALAHIRRLAGLLAEGLDGDDDALPVNMLWPLLMLGSEQECDAEERAWVMGQILRMQRVAGNAKITAQVLEEVQARQDAAKERVDIRSVMHAIFNRCFAIV
ncbi:hypothetical protein DHEL01_v201813 [Diaporthe helianthi]|uniref:Zn(2)-C6 fungal-type domain-containing protein n=1 Tax=Diaporthe helianthi TaxID=158607 RepID=A0A2P5IBC2_DIAHE|nr:hypothetical protein DHEL01_v201813 [Diaporthe helianthi]